MKARPGRVTARLAAPAEKIISEDLINLINQNIKPPSPLTSDDVHIRAMYIVSDQVNSFGGRFPTEELDGLIQLIIDSPVMVGHRKDKLPVGRNFHAEVLDRGEQRWLKTYFYWLKNIDNGETLQKNIDGGVYKECSIGFTFHLAECSICNLDIRTCEHEPFGKYKTGEGDESVCHFNYRQIDKVLETSLVYRGAVRDTKISNALKIDLQAEVHLQIPDIEKVSDLDELGKESKLWVAPCYQGVWVTAGKTAGQLQLRLKDNQTVRSIVSARLDNKSIPDFSESIGLLVGFRGKERCHPAQVNKFLNGQSSPVTRVELKLFPSLQLSNDLNNWNPQTGSVSILRHELVDHGSLKSAIERLRTRDGVLVWMNQERNNPTLLYNLRVASYDSPIGKYTIYQEQNSLVIDFSMNGQSSFHLNIPVNKIISGQLYRISLSNSGYSHGVSSSVIGRGFVHEQVNITNGMTFTVDGPISGKFKVRHGTSKQKPCFLMSFMPGNL